MQKFKYILTSLQENMTLLHANSKGAYQPVHRCSLISAFLFSLLECMITNSSPSEISMFQPIAAADQASFSMARSKTQKTGFLSPRLIFDYLTGRSQVGDCGGWYNPMLKM